MPVRVEQRLSVARRRSPTSTSSMGLSVPSAITTAVPGTKLLFGGLMGHAAFRS
ncbi:hypothetical protein OHA25_48005 [Nonomuraea sp. NBC_00507]|uniref:hypothetical protein n=1 Tax=Nonomuraea sp. NBC_00507 TaxID=2976002 RepID=UPI002E17ED66